MLFPSVLIRTRRGAASPLAVAFAVRYLAVMSKPEKKNS